jgi:hypothetical protein
MFVAQRGEDLRNIAPGGRNGFGVIAIHNYILGYMVLFVKSFFEAL